MITHLFKIWQKSFTPDALPAATLPIYPGLGPASRDTECASDSWVHVVRKLTIQSQFKDQKKVKSKLIKITEYENNMILNSY